MSKISLRALEPADAELLYNWENDPSIWQVSNTLAPFSRDTILKYIETARHDIYETRQLRLMIDLETEGSETTIGTIDMFDFEPLHARAGVGILIMDKQHRGKGYAKEALLYFIRHAFDVMLLHQLYCNISTSNSASIKLFKVCGFVQCGLKKQWNRSAQGYTDELMFQLINPGV